MLLSEILFEVKKKSNYKNLSVFTNGNEIEIRDTKIGSRALVTISKHLNQKKTEEQFDLVYEGFELNIVRWDSTPFDKLLQKGIAAYKDYVGNGFARNIMAKILEIAQEKDIKIISIFAASNYSQSVFNHYKDIGLLIPIDYTKGVYADFHSAYYINENKAQEYINKVKNLNT